MCVRENSPFDKGLVTLPWTPRCVPADQELLPGPRYSRQNKGRRQKLQSVLRFARLIFVLHSRKELNGTHETGGTLIFFLQDLKSVSWTERLHSVWVRSNSVS